jgi:hypothetical protein
MVVSHSSPADLFYCLALMQHVGRADCRFVVSADMLESDRFRGYTRTTIAGSNPLMRSWAAVAAGAGAFVVPRFFRSVDVIPIYREGDDSESRQQVLSSLLGGKLVTIAPEWGNDSHRNVTGLRPLTHGVAAIARRFFETTHEPLTLVPVALAEPGRQFWEGVRVRVGTPYHGMSDQHYPELFAGTEPADQETRREAYRHFTGDLGRRLRELT